MPVHKRSVRNYLLDTRYQLRFTAVIVVISAVLTGSLGWFVMYKAHEASRIVQVQVLGEDVQQEVAQSMVRNDRILLGVLVAFGVTLCVVLAGYGIVLTHKVAGPLYKMTSYLDGIRDGRLGTLYNLRRGDQLVDFFQHFKDAHDALRGRLVEDIELYDRAIATLGDHPLAEELRQARARKQEALD